MHCWKSLSGRSGDSVADVPGTITLFLAGDVMTGRGVDQTLPHPGGPALRESYIKDARDYVALAEERNGPIPRPTDFHRPWGAALAVLDDTAPDARIVNLETSVTVSRDYARHKEIHYRMHPANLGVLAAARIDVCALANNHLLDFGRRGLTETLDALTGAGLGYTGAGRDDAEAWQPARTGRVLVWSVGARSSGIGSADAATPSRPGVALLPDLSATTADRLTGRIATLRTLGDIVVVSVHWGSNWGFSVPRAQVDFARRLVDGGVDVVHGHSSHHPRPVEIYRGRLVLYGCGDLINDYEGIGGYEEYRGDLRALYLPVLDADSGELRELRVVALRSRRMRLERATSEEERWLRAALDLGDAHP